MSRPGGISAEQIDAMIEAGATVEVLAALWKAEIAKQDRALEERRSRDRVRQRRHRESRDVTVTSRDPSLEVSPQTPLPKPNQTPPKGSPPRKSDRGSRLPDDFEMPADWLAWAVERRRWSLTDTRTEAERFCRYWQAKTGKDACKRDWLKTWQNWVDGSNRPNGTAAPQSAQRPMTAEELRRAIRFNEDRGDKAKADEYRRKLDSMGPDPPLPFKVRPGSKFQAGGWHG